VLALADNQPTILCTMVVLGLSLGLVLPGNLATMSLATGAGAQGKVAGINTLALGIGLVIGPIAGTSIYRMGYSTPFWLGCGLLAMVSIIAILATRLEVPPRTVLAKA
jgi:MFS family permease